MECSEQKTCIEKANASSFYRSVYSEIEEIGWEHLVSMAGDLMSLSFRVFGPRAQHIVYSEEDSENLDKIVGKYLSSRDKKGRVHILEVQLDETHPRHPPSVSADVPYIFSVRWSMNSRLKDLMQQFHEHLEKLQEFWSTLEDIDNSLCVVDIHKSSHAISFRQIDIGNDCFIMLFINTKDPRSLPECRFLGSGPVAHSLRKRWQRNCKQWMQDKTFLENLLSILETELPKPPDVQKNDQQIECGICYAQYLPIDDELGPRSGTGTDYTCDNSNCNRAFHSICLGDWLRSITTTRQSYNVLFGNCPYCSEPVAVKINYAKK